MAKAKKKKIPSDPVLRQLLTATPEQLKSIKKDKSTKAKHNNT